MLIKPTLYEKMDIVMRIMYTLLSGLVCPTAGHANQRPVIAQLSGDEIQQSLPGEALLLIKGIGILHVKGVIVGESAKHRVIPHTHSPQTPEHFHRRSRNSTAPTSSPRVARAMLRRLSPCWSTTTPSSPTRWAWRVRWPGSCSLPLPC